MLSKAAIIAGQLTTAIVLFIVTIMWELEGLLIVAALTFAVHLGYRIGTGKWMDPI